MNIKFLGFSFYSTSEKLALSNYIDYMTQRSSQSYRLGEHNRFLFFNTTYSEKYYIGLLLTTKDQKTYCELVNDSGKFIVKVNEVDADSNIMDFNFFVLNKKNGIGMYQYYHQSCSLSSFGYFNNKRFSEFHDEVISQKLSNLRGNDAEERRIKRNYRGCLKWEVMVRREKLKELMLELSKIKAFEYTLTALTVDEPQFKPLKPYVKKERTKLIFSPGSPVRVLADHISDIANSTFIPNGRVVGVDSDNIDRIVRITDNPDCFGEYPYDEVAPKINELDVENFEKSWVIQELLRKCSEYEHIFEADVV
jgi:hypothetical protein